MREAQDRKPEPEPEPEPEKKSLYKDISALRSSVNVLYEKIGANMGNLPLDNSDVEAVRTACNTFLTASEGGYEEKPEGEEAKEGEAAAEQQGEASTEQHGHRGRHRAHSEE